MSEGEHVRPPRTVRVKSELYYKPFLPSVIREWNELPQSIRDSTTLSTFKYRLNSTSREAKPPSYYFEGSRLGQIYHARLRTGCSTKSTPGFKKYNK